MEVVDVVGDKYWLPSKCFLYGSITAVVGWDVISPSPFNYLPVRCYVGNNVVKIGFLGKKWSYIYKYMGVCICVCGYF